MPTAYEDELTRAYASLTRYTKLEQHIFVLYTRLFPNYEWVDATSAVCVMHSEIERLREEKR